VTDLHELTALGQALLVRQRVVSPVELVEHYLARIERFSELLGAFVTVTPEVALDRAKELEADAGTSGLGPLYGVPTAIKDLANTAGIRTTFGAAAFAENVPDFSDEVVLRIERAGMVSLGKTNTPEFGSPCYTESDVAGAARSPYDPDLMAGGSSGGAGAAVGAGMVAVAHGSDGGGSIRIPAACCGIVGLKPTRGRISGAPWYGDPIGLGTNGPLARTVRDAAAMLEVMAGRSVGDPYWAPQQGGFLAACDREPGPLRVGRFSTPVIADVVVDPECLAGLDMTSALLEDLGHTVEDVPGPLSRDAVPVFETCWSVLTALSVVPLPEGTPIRPLTRWLADRGMAVSGPEFGLAIGELRRIAAGALEALAPYDIVLTPTLASPPLPVGAIRDDDDPAHDFENQKAFTPYTSAWNLTGMPAISLPLHQTPRGVPVGVMLAARPAAEEVLLQVAAQLEGAAPWWDRRPLVW